MGKSNDTIELSWQQYERTQKTTLSNGIITRMHWRMRITVTHISIQVWHHFRSCSRNHHGTGSEANGDKQSATNLLQTEMEITASRHDEKHQRTASESRQNSTNQMNIYIFALFAKIRTCVTKNTGGRRTIKNAEDRRQNGCDRKTDLSVKKISLSRGILALKSKLKE